MEKSILFCYTKGNFKKERSVDMLQGKTVLLCVTGGIACYKSASLASMLIKQGCNVHVLMTKMLRNLLAPTPLNP